MNVGPPAKAIAALVAGFRCSPIPCLAARNREFKNWTTVRTRADVATSAHDVDANICVPEVIDADRFGPLYTFLCVTSWVLLYTKNLKR